jgi:predicted HicB family RNase H-like nuclease
MPKTSTLNLRVAPEFKRRLIEEAGKQKRSVTNYLEVTLSDLWDKKSESSAEKGKKRRDD